MDDKDIIFEQIRSSGCLSYLIGSRLKSVGAVIDPEIDKTEEYLGLARDFSIELVYAIDTHTHADHNSACKILRDRAGLKVLMHECTEAPYVDLRTRDDDIVEIGDLGVKVLHTPGHTQDSTCLITGDRIFTGDTLLIGGCGRTDLPGGNAERQYESLQRLLNLGDELRVFPAHDYRQAVARLGDEKKSNPRMLIPSREEFVQFMTSRKPPLPRKIQSALEWNRTPIQGTQRGMGEGI